MTADNPLEKIKLKMFNSIITNTTNLKTIETIIKMPAFHKLCNSHILDNFYNIKVDINNLIT